MVPSNKQHFPTFACILPRQQATLALLATIGILGLLAHRGYHSWCGAPLIPIDEAPRPTVRLWVDVNRADWPELTMLPRIGERLAQRIIESREREGPFRDVDQLSRVRGIGPKTLDELRPYLEPIAASDESEPAAP